MSFIIPDYSNIYCTSKYCVRYFYVLIAIIPILLFLFWLTRKTFVKFNNKFELENYVKSKKTDRKIVLALRSFAFVFLMIAIASPFMLESKTVPGNPRLTILVDNSTSMALYNPNIAYNLYKKLEGTVPVQIRTIAGGEHSTIGNGILNNIEGDDNVLVVTDGVNNEGKVLGDIMLFASGINSSISTLKMDAVKNDVGVTIDGPPELIKDTEGDFVVKVSVIGSSIPYTLQVSMDDSVLILEEQGSGSKTFAFSKIFPEGEYHKLTARLLNVGKDDYFQNNNAYYKSVKIVPRPKILYMTQKTSPLAEQLFKIYEVDVRDSLPQDLSDYMAVIFNDIPASSINSRIDGLSSYVSDGNGLIFLGGEHSYDRGGYKGTLLETLLPVKIGASEESNKSDINIALVIDISSSTSESIGLEKALAISVVDSLSEKNNIGAVAFGNGHTERCQAFDILPGGLKPLKEVKKELKDRISKLDFDGQSCFDVGIQGGAQLLGKVGGSKNIIFISDGKTTYKQLRENTLNIVRSVNAQGVKIFTVGVGTDTDVLSSDNNLFLDNIARLGEGIYFKTDASNKLKVQFGDKDETKGEEFYNTLIPIDTSHFITLAMDDMHATISGYNYMVPKPAARLLVTTQKNIPILAVWRFGLGRVVTFGTDDGSRWAGALLNKENSKLITKSINWAIGDLARKKSYDVSIADTVLGKSTSVNVITKDMPKGYGLAFAKIDTNLYSSPYTPAEIGFKDLLGATFATNYNDEYANLGINPEFTTLVQKTGGKVFEPGDTKGIIEFIKAKSKRIKIDSTDYRWPFAIIAMLLFLAEIAIRRFRENAQR
ncbi:MAG TPA: VWA domain-containing protein [Candidatus Nanoarchaeia archaeon]|nr:VWA domain-containing protein [Candidatus Nanoarchaeia archaeon]